MEQRLNVSKWAPPPNANNAVLQRGAEQLGYSWDTIPRNVAGCWDTGYCGVGCPVDAKKSMLVTTVPAALDRDATLIYRVEVQGVTISGGQVTGIEGYAKSPNGEVRTGRKVTVRARHTILAAGAINTPGILLRSNVPDPYGRIGKRTFLHPVTISLAQFDEPIDPFYGAPQSIYSDQFNWAEGVVGPMGYKLEVIPLLPGTFAAVVGGHGIPLENAIKRHAYTQGTMAFLRDGFHDDSQGGAVELGDAGTPILDYPVTEYIQDGARRALADMMEIQFAAGAKAVKPSHAEASWYSSLEEGLRALSELSFGWGKVRLSSAHAMGGCAMGEDETLCVTDSRGRFRHLGNLSIFDGSLFPTGLGANPQMSIFGFVHKFAADLGNELAQ